MSSTQRSIPCGCACHQEATVVHVSLKCDCGKPITCPPRKRPKCPPVEPPTQPGTVDVGQETPPPTFTTSDVPPWTVGKPPPRDPTEIPWIKNQIGQVLRNGPKFGPRKDEYLPYLLIRAASGDRGGRPLNGVFWESPDIFVLPDQDADTAPLRPTSFGAVAQANVPNTLYAHVWNLGKAPAYRVRVEFYWFNPSLGISRADANLIGAAWIDLGNRFTLYKDWVEVKESYGQWVSQGCHAVVRCPVSWVPTYENNGHECLVVRVFEPMMDAVDPSQFSAAADRHVAQHNIAVVQAASPAEIDLALTLGPPDAPTDAEVDISADGPATMEWLQLLSGARVTGFNPPTSPIEAGLLPPTMSGARVPPISKLPAESQSSLLKGIERFHKGCCPANISFHASAPALRPSDAQVFRIRQRVAGQVVGGYSVVLLGPRGAAATGP
jgi:hypothetical protein